MAYDFAERRVIWTSRLRHPLSASDQLWQFHRWIDDLVLFECLYTALLCDCNIFLVIFFVHAIKVELDEYSNIFHHRAKATDQPR